MAILKMEVVQKTEIFNFDRNDKLTTINLVRVRVRIRTGKNFVLEFERGKNLRVGIPTRENFTCWNSNKGKIYVLEFEQGKNLRGGIRYHSS